jgi:hypothetical protein
VSQYPSRRRQYQETKVARRQIPLFPSFEISSVNRTSRFDRATSVDITEQLDLEYACFPIFDELKITYVVPLLHDAKDVTDKL